MEHSLNKIRILNARSDVSRRPPLVDVRGGCEGILVIVRPRPERDRQNFFLGGTERLSASFPVSNIVIFY